jgi:hypothetical protein
MEGHGLVPHSGGARGEAALDLRPGTVVAHEDLSGTCVGPGVLAAVRVQLAEGILGGEQV